MPYTANTKWSVRLTWFLTYVIRECWNVHVRLTRGMRNMRFTAPWKALYLHISTNALIFFETYVYTHSGKCMFKTRLFYVHYLTYVNAHEWTYIIHAILKICVYHASKVRLNPNRTVKTCYSLAKTGNKLGICHGWFHLHWLIWAVNHAKKVRITKWNILAHSETRIHYLSIIRLAI